MYFQYMDMDWVRGIGGSMGTRTKNDSENSRISPIFLTLSKKEQRSTTEKAARIFESIKCIGHFDSNRDPLCSLGL